MINKFTIMLCVIILLFLLLFMPNNQTNSLFESDDFSIIEPSASLIEVHVNEVISGDTFVAEFSDGHTEKIKLLGIEAPQYGAINEPGGEEAKIYLEQILQNSTNIYIEYDENDGSNGTHQDYLGRTMAWVWVDYNGETLLLQELMVAEGYITTISNNMELKYISNLQQQ